MWSLERTLPFKEVRYWTQRGDDTESQSEHWKGVSGGRKGRRRRGDVAPLYEARKAGSSAIITSETGWESAMIPKERIKE